MTKPNRHLLAENPVRPKAETLAAALLILVGVVFQYVEISYRHASMDNFWYISVILNTVWKMADFCLNSSYVQDALRFGPLALLTAGVIMLWSAKRAVPARVPKEGTNG